MPSHESVRDNRWLTWLGPRVLDARLWHLRRRPVALGVALGVFFGLLIPVAQIPASAGAAVVLRANIPAAIGSTLVTNPFTFAPVYVFAHGVGSRLLNEAAPPGEVLAAAEAAGETGPVEGWRNVPERLAELGRPLMLGLLVVATTVSLLTYATILVLWRLRVTRAWRERRRRRQR